MGGVREPAPVVFRQPEWVAGSGAGCASPQRRGSGARSESRAASPAARGPGRRARPQHPSRGAADRALLRLPGPGRRVRPGGARGPAAAGLSRGAPASVGGEMAAGGRTPAPPVLACFGALLGLWVTAGLEAVVIGEAHENVTLLCGNISGLRGLVTWYRNDSEPVFLLSSDPSLLPAESRYSLVDTSSLHIEALSLQDEGNYTCHEALNNETRWFPVWLQVTSGPYQVEVNISSTGKLPNGTLYAAKGSQVDFSCSSSSWPPAMVEWWFRAPDARAEPFGNNLTSSCFKLLLMSQNLQGNYTCLAMNMLSGRLRNVTTELLVYSPPPSVPQCWAEMSPGSFRLQLICRWDKGYPDPDFLWTEEPEGVVVGKSPLGVEVLNRSQLSDGKKFKCVGSHIVGPTSGASCMVRIKSPSLLAEPMKTCFVGGNVTLTCQVSGAYPPAKVLWLRNLTQPEVVIQPSSHYVVTHSGQNSTLTIRNCSQDLDEGYYVCRAENPVGLREVDIWLSVKEPLNIGGIVGTIVSLLLLGLAIISGLILYYSPVFCWKVGSTLRGQDMGDVMFLVDSEEEEAQEEEGAAEEEEEEEAHEREELPKEIHKHGHIHRVTALVNGNIEQMGNGLPVLQDDSSEQQSELVLEEDRPV